ncbi:MAG TPA: carbohydrate ABC transporter permease [Gaiellaceae bacterium]|jgi:multiple sugar transport system permease protein
MSVAVRRSREAAGATRVVRGRRFRLGSILRFGFIALYVCFLLLPLYWVAITSIKPQDDLLVDPPIWWPANPTGLHYSTALNAFRGWKGLENSLIIAFATTVIAVAIGTAAAYSMARFRTGGKHLAFWYLSQRLMPPVAIIIPVFLLFSRYTKEWIGISLVDTRIGLVLLYTVFALPFTVWMMYAYFRQMPAELEEAALVDGCTRVQALWKVAWPLAAPGIVSAAAFAFILSWTEFIFAQVLSRTNAITLPVALAGIITGFQGNQYGEASALTMVSLVPAILLGILIQRHLVRGLTLGAVQG